MLVLAKEYRELFSQNKNINYLTKMLIITFSQFNKFNDFTKKL